jgi:hypothetical protein
VISESSNSYEITKFFVWLPPCQFGISKSMSDQKNIFYVCSGITIFYLFILVIKALMDRKSIHKIERDARDSLLES